MSEEDLVKYIMDDIAAHIHAINKDSDWATAQQSVMQQILEGVVAGVHVGLAEHRDKINELVLLTTWLLFTHPSGVMTNLPDALIPFLQKPIKHIDPLT